MDEMAEKERIFQELLEISLSDTWGFSIELNAYSVGYLIKLYGYVGNTGFCEPFEAENYKDFTRQIIGEIAFLKHRMFEQKQKYLDSIELKEGLKTLKGDKQDILENLEGYEEYEQKKKELKVLKDTIDNLEDVRIITEKISTLKERMDLLKEIIKAELIEMNASEIKKDGRKLKIMQILKEMKNED